MNRTMTPQRKPAPSARTARLNRWANIATALSLSTALAMSLAASEALAQAQPHNPPQELVDAAKAEGSFMFYASISEPQIENLLEGFEARYGIRGEYLRLVSATLIQRFATAFDAGGNEADVLLDSSPTAFEQHPEMFVNLTEEQLPSLLAWPEQWRGERQAIIQTSAMVVQYNTDLVQDDEVPRAWTDILDPRWRGQISLTDPRISNTYLGWLDAMERRHGPDFVRSLGEQEFTLVQSGAGGAQMVAAGSQAINFPAYASFSIPLKEAGAPIEWQVMTDPQSTNQTGIAIVAESPNPNAARLFMDWALSREGIAHNCAMFPLSSPGDMDGELNCIALSDPQVVDYDVDEDRRQELLELLNIASD